jgi:hypothetical protein
MTPIEFNQRIIQNIIMFEIFPYQNNENKGQLFRPHISFNKDYLLLQQSLSPLPALKLGSLYAGIFIEAPV